MKHPRFTAWLCSAAALVLLAVPAFAQQPDALPPEQTAPAAQEQTAEAAAPDAEAPTAEAPAADPQRTYVALGDSIVSGVGLPDFKYTEAAIGIDAAPNFEGYPEQCYVSLVGKGLGLDRQHAINLGLPGLTTGDLADMLHTGAMPQMNQQAGTYYVYPQMLDYLKRADVISVQIGSNDALVPALVALGNATNWKSEQLVATMVSGVLREPSFENLQRLNSDLSRLRLTKEEKQATTQLLLGGGTDAICEQAYQEAAVHMPEGHGLTSMELCVLFANCLDNAMESAADPAVTDKVIRVNGGEHHGCLVVRFENACARSLQLKDGQLPTSKKSGVHGYGLKNIRTVLERHDGTLSLQPQRGRFVLTWLLPLDQKAPVAFGQNVVK